MNTTFTKTLLSVSSVLWLAVTAPANAQGVQFLVHEASGMCVDVSGAPGIANGAKLQLWACETKGNRDNGSETDQRWSYQNGFVRNSVSAKCFDVPGAPGTAPGLQLQLWDCENSGKTGNGAQTDQQFDYVDGQFRNRISGLCVGPKQTNYSKNGQPLVLVKCAKPGAADLEFSFRNPAPAAAKKPAAPVAQSKPALIYPDFPGASQSCAVPINPDNKRYSVTAGAQIMLSNCTASQGGIFLVSKERITIAGKPNLCVNVGAGAKRAILYLEECKDTVVKTWDAGGTSVEARRIRSVGGQWDNLCWSVPGLNDPKMRFPTPIEASDCKAGKDLQFFVEPQ